MYKVFRQSLKVNVLNCLTRHNLLEELTLRYFERFTENTDKDSSGAMTNRPGLLGSDPGLRVGFVKGSEAPNRLKV